ncbi:MAG: hypothetical protein ACKO39_08080, partial [Chthoniobacterales bacterium]
MKTNPKTRFHFIASFLLLLAFVFPAVGAEALKDAKPFLGWIPMQPAAPGEKVEIDMRRFFYPGQAKPVAL